MSIQRAMVMDVLIVAQGIEGVMEKLKYDDLSFREQELISQSIFHADALQKRLNELYEEINKK